MDTTFTPPTDFKINPCERGIQRMLKKRKEKLPTIAEWLLYIQVSVSFRPLGQIRSQTATSK